VGVGAANFPWLLQKEHRLLEQGTATLRKRRQTIGATLRRRVRDPYPANAGACLDTRKSLDQTGSQRRTPPKPRGPTGSLVLWALTHVRQLVRRSRDAQRSHEGVRSLLTIMRHVSHPLRPVSHRRSLKGPWPRHA